MMDLNQICEQLADQPLFQGLAPEALADVAGYVRRQAYEAGATVVWQGEASTTVSLMVRGLAAVTHLAGADQEAHILAYLMPGASFGEVGILDQQPRSATVQALTEVEVLVLARDDFLAILQRYAPVAIALARRLGQYLVEADRRYHQETNPARMILLCDLGVGAGASLFGQALAAHLARQAASKTALVVYHGPGNDTGLAPGSPESVIIPQSAGYERIIAGINTQLPPAVQTTLLADRIARQYDNAVIVLPKLSNTTRPVWLMHAQHVILFVAPSARGREQLRLARHNLAQYTASGRTGVSVVAGLSGESAEQLGDIGADYVLALDKLSPLQGIEVSAELERTVTTLVKRINHTHQIAIYVPTTVAVDHIADTSGYVERTLAFLGTRFGGATSAPANGVWQSEVAGLVHEAVHVVQTYATNTDLQRHLPEVVNYVKRLKQELQQEAMALEVDHQLMLL
jgi:CRP-like cAMP-binding protein